MGLGQFVLVEQSDQALRTGKPPMQRGSVATAAEADPRSEIVIVLRVLVMSLRAADVTDRRPLSATDASQPV